MGNTSRVQRRCLGAVLRADGVRVKIGLVFGYEVRVEMKRIAGFTLEMPKIVWDV